MAIKIVPTLSQTTDMINAAINRVKDKSLVQADAADADGKSQLFKEINGVRVNIDPKTSGGADELTDETFAAKMDNQIGILTNIAKKLGYLTEWGKIQKMVRNGTFADHYAVGDQLNVNYNGSPMVWDIVAIDIATPADTSKTHSVTLMPHNTFYDDRAFDAVEPNNPDFDRKSFGNNRYAHSAIRQWLNSSANAGNWWVAQHEYDAAPDYATTVDGFMKGFDADFLAVLGLTKFKVAKNTATDSGGYEELTDTFYLPSKMEVGLGAENSIEEGAQFPYFTDNASRIKYKEGTTSASGWWLRTPESSQSVPVYYVLDSGNPSYFLPISSYGVAPVCNII